MSLRRRHLPWLLLAALACRDAASLNGTAVLVTTQTGGLEVDQLRYQAWVDGGTVLPPTSRPTTPTGPLASSTSVRVLLPDALGQQLLDVTVTGLRAGVEEAQGSARVRLETGREVATTVQLVTSTPTCSGCEGCCTSAGSCVHLPGVGACGVGGSACQLCDTVSADTCGSDGRCHCGNGPPCTAALGGDECAGGQCQCGTGPACESGQECLQRACQCTSASCSGGCCLGTVCVTSPSSAACGTGGGACLDCGATACSGGQCGTALCNAGNCPDGCCAGATCEGGRDAGQCGAGGRRCTSCGAGSCDDAGVCLGSCGPDTCPLGCCLEGVCQGGTDAGACGQGGLACDQCPTTCTNHRCDAPCSAATCPGGCCQAGVCRLGTEAAACGLDGGACQACAGATCTAGACVGCSATTCTGGCCDPGGCRTPATTTCGSGGKACVSCLTRLTDSCRSGGGSCGCGNGGACLTGQVCDGGACQCDPATCAGCCSGTTCQAGDAKKTCGRDGGLCADCGSAKCTAGACQ